MNQQNNVEEEKGIVIATNENGQVSKDTFEYNEYRESILNFSNLTTKENSIIIDFNIAKGNVYNNVKKIEQNGYHEQLKSQQFVYGEAFKSGLLEPFLIEFAKNHNNKIVITDISTGIVEETCDYRMITENNDMVTVNGLDREYANYIAEEISKITYNTSMEDEEKSPILVKEIDEKGKGNTLVIILTIILIGITLLGTIYFTVVANR